MISKCCHNTFQLKNRTIGLIEICFSEKKRSNRDFELWIVFEFTTEVGSVFHWSTPLTLKYDLRAIVLYCRPFDFMLLPLVTFARYISISFSILILSNSLILKRDLHQIPCNVSIMERENMSSCFNISSYDELCNVRMCFVAFIVFFSVSSYILCISLNQNYTA